MLCILLEEVVGMNFNMRTETLLYFKQFNIIHVARSCIIIFHFLKAVNFFLKLLNLNWLLIIIFGSQFTYGCDIYCF